MIEFDNGTMVKNQLAAAKTGQPGSRKGTGILETEAA